ncbi:MAG: GFA family protein [Alphaproteobacteria bacterium]|nr:GFA family protein [Alphaproteobacteria bacterium]
MKIDGGCHCGALTYEADIDPEKVAVCHCTDCQKMSGTAFRTVAPAAEENFKLLSGEPKIYVKVGGSGAKRAQAFCADCGSQIYGTSVGDGPKTYGIRLGTVRQSQELAPKLQIWTRSAQPWLSGLDAVPKIEQG